MRDKHRYLTKQEGSPQWKNYTEQDYVFNVRLFRRFMQKKDAIMRTCLSLQTLPATDEATTRRRTKRAVRDNDLSSTPPKKKFKVIVLDLCDSTSSDGDSDDGKDDDKGDDKGDDKDDDKAASCV
jgi:hypothetical protein